VVVIGVIRVIRVIRVIPVVVVGAHAKRALDPVDEALIAMLCHVRLPVGMR